MASDLVGWVAIGPAETLCLACAPTAEDVRRHYAPHHVDLLEVVRTANLARYECVVCERVLVEVADQQE